MEGNAQSQEKHLLNIYFTHLKIFSVSFPNQELNDNFCRRTFVANVFVSTITIVYQNR